MSNKLYGDNVKDYLVEGAGKNGYMKISNKGFGDGPTSPGVKNFNEELGSSYGQWNSKKDWFEGNKSSVGTGGRGAKGL